MQRDRTTVQPAKEVKGRVPRGAKGNVMKKKKLVDRVAALVPRNLFAPLAARRAAGRHTSAKRKANQQHKDLVQRLREAGL